MPFDLLIRVGLTVDGAGDAETGRLAGHAIRGRG
jgi:hypothetical protein